MVVVLSANHHLILLIFLFGLEQTDSNAVSSLYYLLLSIFVGWLPPLTGLPFMNIVILCNGRVIYVPWCNG